MINVYTDASVCSDTQLATYAYFIDDKKKILKTGIYEKKTKSTNIAEMVAILNALYYIVLHYGNSNSIKIFCDSSFAINKLRGNVIAYKHEKEIIDQIEQLSTQHALWISYQKVEGHGDCLQNLLVDYNANCALKTQRIFKELNYG